MDTKILKAFGIFLIFFVLLIGGLIIYDNLTKVEVLKNDHLADVTHDEKKNNIYIFWGNGCAHCEELRVFLEDNTSLWTKDYQIFSFETWKDEENATLMDDVLAFLDRENEGTPTILIGDEVIVGFSSSSEEEFKTILEQQKNNDYDALEEFKNNKEKN